MERARVIRGIVEVIMPAGSYAVGDPCYSVSEEHWHQWLDDAGSGERIVFAEIDGQPVIGLSTRYGDGMYEDQDGRSYPVDAGLIGMVPARLIDEKSRPREGELFHIMTFGEPVRCAVEGGRVVIGKIQIETGDDDDE